MSVIHPAARSWTRWLSVVHHQASTTLLIIGISVVGLALRLINLRNEFVFDEVFSVHYAQLPVGKIFSIPSQDLFYNLILKTWIILFGHSEVAVRLLSVVSGLLAIVLLYQLGYVFFNRYTGIIAALLLGVLPIPVILSQEARAYSLFIVLVIGSLIAFWRYYQFHRTSSLIWYIVITLILLHTQVQGWCLVVAQLIFLLIYHRRIVQSLRHWYLAFSIIVFGSIPWLLLRAVPLHLSSYWKYDWLSVITNHFSRVTTVVDVALNFIYMVSWVRGPLAIVGVLLFGLGLVSLVVGLLVRNNKLKVSLSETFIQNPALMLIMLVLLIAFCICLVTNIPIPKYYIVAVPLLYLLIAYGIAICGSWRPVLYYIGMLIILASIFVTAQKLTANVNNTHSWQRTTNYISDHEYIHDVIIINSFKYRLFFDYYFRGTSPVKGFYPKENFNDLDQEIAQYNPLLMKFITPENIEILSTMTRQANRVWYVNCASAPASLDPTNLALDWFRGHGWQVSSIQFLPRGIIYLIEPVSTS